MLWNWRPSKKDSAFSWVVTVASFLSLFLSLGLSYGSIGVMTVAFGDKYRNSTQDELAWIGATRSGFMLCTGVCWSAVVNKIGSRLVQIAGSVVLTVAVGVSTLANEVWHLYVAFGALGGVGVSLIFTAASVAVDGHFDRFVHIALPLSQLGATVGYCVFPVLTNLMVEALGLESTLYAFCGLAVVPGLLALPYTGGVRLTEQHVADPSGELGTDRLDRSSSAMQIVATAISTEVVMINAVNGVQEDSDLPASPASSSGGSSDGSSFSGSPASELSKEACAAYESVTAGTRPSAAVEQSQWRRFRNLLATGGTWLVMASFFGLEYTCSTIFVLLPSIVADAGGFPADDAAIGVTIFGATSVAAHVVTTVAALRTYNHMLLYAVACVLFGCATTAFVAGATSATAFYLLCAFGGSWFGIAVGLLLSVIHHFSRAGYLSDLFGLTTLAAGLGGLAGPGLTGVIQAGAGNAAGMYVSGAFAIVAGASLLASAVQRQRELSGALLKQRLKR